MSGYSAAVLALLLLALGGPLIATTVSVAERFSSDGAISVGNTRILSLLLLGVGAMGGCAAALLFGLLSERRRNRVQRVLYHDDFARRGLRVPGPYTTLAVSTAAGLAIVLLWWIKRWLPSIELLFANEGPLEILTFILEVAAAACLGYGFLRFKSSPHAADRWTARAFAACAVVLFIIGMEEINWGQTFLGFRTPDGWAAINYQQQTSLHNLVDMETLGTAARVAAYVVVGGSLALMIASFRAPGSNLASLSPTPPLGGLLLAILYSGTVLHAEVTELLLAVFFAFYGYRVLVAARALAAAQDRAERPIRRLT